MRNGKTGQLCANCGFMSAEDHDCIGHLKKVANHWKYKYEELAKHLTDLSVTALSLIQREEIQQNEDQRPESSRDKTSFNSFGDNLEELILSYLPFEEKFRFECISKCIQKLIFNKENVLKIDRNCCFVQPKEVKNGFRGYCVDIPALKSILQKLNSLHSIQVDLEVDIDGRLLRVVADNCPMLRHFDCGSVIWDSEGLKLTVEDIEYFIFKCGKNLKTFGIFCDHCIKGLATFAPNVESIGVRYLHSVLDTKGNSTNNGLKMFENLSAIQMKICNTKDLIQFQSLYHSDITKIVTAGIFLESIPFELSPFESLRELNITSRPHHVETQPGKMRKNLELLPQLCPQLTKLIFAEGINTYPNLFDVVGQLKNLVYFKCCLYAYKATEVLYGSVKKLRGLTKLKHLKLLMRQLNKDNLKSIEKALPNLESIQLKTENRITDRLMRSLSEIKGLREVKIQSRKASAKRNITDAGVKRLVENCPLLKRLELVYYPNFDEDDHEFGQYRLTRKTVNRFICKAKQNPKVLYTLRIGEVMDVCEEFDEIIESEDFPSNLRLEESKIDYSE